MAKPSIWMSSISSRNSKTGGKSSQRELASRLIILTAHLLKGQFQFDKLSDQWKEFEGKSWRNTLLEQRTQLGFLLAKAPSLTAALDLACAEAYPAARRLAIKATGLPPDGFPDHCPYTIDQLLDEDFHPESVP